MFKLKQEHMQCAYISYNTRLHGDIKAYICSQSRSRKQGFKMLAKYQILPNKYCIIDMYELIKVRLIHTCTHTVCSYNMGTWKLDSANM